MNRNSGRIRTTCVVFGLLAISALPAAARCVESEGNRGLEGHWVITIQSGGDRFVNLVTFTRGGDIEIFASYRQTISIGRGTYCRSGDKDFDIVIVQLGYNAALVQNEFVTIRSTIKLNAAGDELTGPDNVEVVDPITGQVLFSGPGGSVGGKLVKPQVP